MNSTFGASYPGVEGGLVAASTHGRVALSGHRCVIEPLDLARHDRTGFSCGVVAVDNYFKKTANKLAKAGNVMVGADRALIGLYAINAHAVRYQDLPARFARARPGHVSIPAAFIAMFGRDQRYSGAGFGADLIVDALRRIDKASDSLGIAVVLLKRLPEFIQARKNNWETLRRGLSQQNHVLEFALPTHATSWDPEHGFSWDTSGCRTNCSWFGFKIAVKPSAPFSRTELAIELDRNLIGNRMLFGGNLLRQPAFVQLHKDNPEALKTVGAMAGSDEIMATTLFLGTYPGLTEEMLAYEIEVINNFCSL